MLFAKIVRIQNLGPQFVASRCFPRMAHKLCIIRAKDALKRHVVTPNMVVKRCRLSKTCKPPSGGGSSVPGQGRPLGLLLGWLTWSKLPQCEESWQHSLYRPDFEYRNTCRDKLAKSDKPTIKALLDAERAQFAWERPEPIVSE